jgi:hypothetical protein
MAERTSYPGGSVLGDAMRALWERLALSIARRLPYHAIYHARLEAQSDDKVTADVKPFALRPGLKSPLPEDGVATIRMLVGAPGLRVTAAQGSGVLVAFRGGEPAGAVVLPCWDGGESGVEWAAVLDLLDVDSDDIRLGGTDPVVTKKDLQVLFAAISGAAVVPNDGGASLKAAILAALTTAGWTTGSGDGHLGSTKAGAGR